MLPYGQYRSWLQKNKNSGCGTEISNGPDRPRNDLRTRMWPEIIPDPGGLEGKLRN